MLGELYIRFYNVSLGERREYYYKPQGYRKYIRFRPANGNLMGTPEHNISLPDDAQPYEPCFPGEKSYIKFLDTCFSS